MNQPPRKDELISQIAQLLGVESPGISKGSTGTKDIYVLINDTLGLGLGPTLTKQQLARGIVEASGNAWLPSFDSTGSTITRKGLEAVLHAVQFFLQE